MKEQIEQFDIFNYKATFIARFFAYLIDIIPFVLLSIIIFYFIYGTELFAEKHWRITTEIGAIGDIPLRVAIRYFAFILWIIYCSIMEASSMQATYGKRVLGITVVNHSGERISLQQSIIRNLIKIISYVIIGLGFFWVLLSKKNKGWHDYFAKTYVVTIR